MNFRYLSNVHKTINIIPLLTKKKKNWYIVSINTTVHKYLTVYAIHTLWLHNDFSFHFINFFFSINWSNLHGPRKYNRHCPRNIIYCTHGHVWIKLRKYKFFYLFLLVLTHVTTAIFLLGKHSRRALVFCIYMLFYINVNLD